MSGTVRRSNFEPERVERGAGAARLGSARAQASRPFSSLLTFFSSEAEVGNSFGDRFLLLLIFGLQVMIKKQCCVNVKNCKFFYKLICESLLKPFLLFDITRTVGV